MVFCLLPRLKHLTHSTSLCSRKSVLIGDRCKAANFQRYRRVLIGHVRLSTLPHTPLRHLENFIHLSTLSELEAKLIFCNGLNWLVYLSVWLAASSKSTSGKILGVWFPVMTFVAIGYEHSVANMFFLPVAMLEGFGLSICELFTNNLMPATIGNIIGGALFMGGGILKDL